VQRDAGAADALALAATLPTSVGDAALRVEPMSAGDLTTFAPEPLADAVEAAGGSFETGHGATAAGTAG
jgi:hypothetical protein